MARVTTFELSQDGIQFNAVNKSGAAAGAGNTSGNYNSESSFNELTVDGKFTNAVDIDWNGADLSSAASSFANAADTAPVSTITTTVELIKEVYSPMFAKAA